MPVIAWYLRQINTQSWPYKNGGKSKGGHYLVFQGKTISKKSHCHRGSHFLMYQNKVTTKKKLFNLGMPIVKCSCDL